MRRYAYKKYLLLLGALLLLFCFPSSWLTSLRSGFVSLSTPLFSLCSLPSPHADLAQLESENLLLRNEISKLRALLEQLAYAPPETPSSLVVAQVIYRDPSSWSSAVWVDVGSEQTPLVQKDSPVLLGKALVGVVDYVGKRHSRVRLLTDASLHPSVRAVRGNPQNRVLLEHLYPLLRHMTVRKDLPLSKEETLSLGKQLVELQERLTAGEGEGGWYLAKGVLQGSGTPLWKSSNQTLRGIGFNYDFADDKGPARDLVSGKPLDIKSSAPSLPLLKVHDLLITTGLDGVFPPNLLVAEVSKVFPLREGAYTYEIEATPIVGNLDTLRTLFLIPPIGYDGEEEK